MPEGVIFTSGGTESDNLALRGMAFKQLRKRNANRILISPVEHHAVLTTAEQLRDEFGFELDLVKVDSYGRVDLDDLQQKISERTAIVSIIYANNEIGTIQDMDEIAKICHSKGVMLHSDAVQAAAHLNIDLESSGIDMISIGAHKFYGPKGIGALISHDEPDLLTILTGGKQENNHRAGTHNVPLIVGLAEALELQKAEHEKVDAAMVQMRDSLIREVLNRIPDAILTGHPLQRLPNHASFVFDGADGNQLLIQLDMAGFACSSGSACKVGDPKPSDVLLAIGVPPRTALGSLRVTLGRNTRIDEVERFCNILPKLVEANRKANQ
jgi:cysteine desulfurase